MVPEAYIQKVLQLAAQGVARLPLPRVRHRLGQRGLSHGRRAELQQQRARAQPLLRGAGRRTASGRLTRRTDGAEVSKRIPAARDCGTRSRTPRGPPPIPACSTTRTINEWHTCPEDGRINASNPCVTGDTLVATAEGWRRIDELVGRSARIIGADGLPHLVTRIFPTGRKPIYTLTHAGRAIGADHRRPSRADDRARRCRRSRTSPRTIGSCSRGPASAGGRCPITSRSVSASRWETAA